MQEDDGDARVAQQQGADLGPADGAAVAHPRDEDHQRRVDEEHEALQAGADVLQAEEVEQARQIEAPQAQKPDREPLTRVEARRAGAAGPQGRDQEEGQRQEHAQRQQGHRVHGVTVGELDEDRLGREGDGGEQNERGAGESIAAGNRLHVADPCGRSGSGIRARRAASRTRGCLAGVPKLPAQAAAAGGFHQPQSTDAKLPGTVGHDRTIGGPGSWCQTAAGPANPCAWIADSCPPRRARRPRAPPVDARAAPFPVPRRRRTTLGRAMDRTAAGACYGCRGPTRRVAVAATTEASG